MSFKPFFEICDAFFYELKPNVYGDVENIDEKEKESSCNNCLSSYINKVVIFILTCQKEEQNNEFKYHIY
jgi:hypothetical protein